MEPKCYDEKCLLSSKGPHDLCMFEFCCYCGEPCPDNGDAPPHEVRRVSSNIYHRRCEPGLGGRHPGG